MFSKLIKYLKGKTGTYRSMNDTGFIQIDSSFGSGITFADGTQIGGRKKIDKRKGKKPVEIWEQLKIQDEPAIDLTDLDEKIKIIKKRIEVLEEHTGGRDLQEEHDVLGYLEARKKYNKHKKLFAYPTTNQEMINELCKNYKVKVANLNQYSGTMPQEAIDELAKFKLACRKVRKDKPVVRLIVPDTEEMKKKKRDPILLVSSPFGNWDYILGAWDKEVLIVDDLIYLGK